MNKNIGESRSGTRDRAVLVEQIRFVYSNGPRSIPFNVINPLILVIVLWPVAAHRHLISWFVAMLLVSVWRFIHVRRALRADTFVRDAEGLSRRFVIGSTATALLWSTGFLSIGLSLPLVHLMLFLLVIGGMGSGAFTSMGTHRQGFLLFISALFIPVLIYLTTHISPLAVTIGIFIAMFAGMLALTHGVTYRILLEGIRDRIDNERLVKQLERINSRLEITNSELGTRAETDSLTGIANRRYFEQRFIVEWQRAHRDRTSIACLMIDVDYFKQFNDHYGHAAGDECLKLVAGTLDKNIKRATDIFARYGGEEFIVLLPDTPLDNARSIAERLNKAINDEAIPHEGVEDAGHVTISIGVAAATPATLSDKHALVKAADEALYAAKNQGRNRVEVYEGGEPT